MEIYEWRTLLNTVLLVGVGCPMFYLLIQEKKGCMGDVLYRLRNNKAECISMAMVLFPICMIGSKFIAIGSVVKYFKETYSVYKALKQLERDR